MCSRFTLNLGDAINLSKRLGVPLGEIADATDRFNIAPSTGIIALRRSPADPTTIEATTLHWGLIPHWVKDRKATPPTLINARSETAAEKPSFRSPWQRRQRCVIPTSGFYEWEKDGRARLPWIFTRADQQPVLFAGLWERWQDPIDQTLIESCTVLTTTANAMLGRIHERMPVILDEEVVPTWLDPDFADAASLMRPFDADRMRETALDPYLNSTRHEGPQCLTPRGQSPGTQLGFDL